MKTVSKSLCSLLGAILITIASYPCYATSNPLSASKDIAHYVVVVNKKLNSKKHKFRLFTDAGKENILFSVNGMEGKNYQLYVFDMESKLVTQISVHNQETSVLNNISKGNYLFEVLIGDEKIESGQLKVK